VKTEINEASLIENGLRMMEGVNEILMLLYRNRENTVEFEVIPSTFQSLLSI
jgi:hypothetical protein